jgi:hypothetical protein
MFFLFLSFYFGGGGEGGALGTLLFVSLFRLGGISINKKKKKKTGSDISTFCMLYWFI